MTDVGVIYFNQCRHMFHHECITKFCGVMDSNKHPRCNSVDSYVDCQSYDEQNNMLKYICAINGDNVKGNDNDDNTTAVATATGDCDDYVGGNNDDDVANDNNNNDNVKNNDKNNNDNDNYDDKQTYNNKYECNMCQVKLVDATPEDLSVMSYEEKYKVNIVLVLSIISCKHKFHELCWTRYWLNLSKKINGLNVLRVVSLIYITIVYLRIILLLTILLLLLKDHF